MGEIADMMLDGTLCAGCGSAIDFDGGDGIPRYCSDACFCDVLAPGVSRTPAKTSAPRTSANTVTCPICKRRAKLTGLGQHVRDAHPETQMES